MEFPRFVFRNGGPIDRAGGTFNQALVLDQSEYSAAIKAGWFENLQYAIDAPKVEQVVTEAKEPEHVEPAEDAPPTREEMEAKAVELGIHFDGRTGDRKLAALIAKALEV